MKSLSPGLQQIRFTGKVLAFAALFGTGIFIFQYIFNGLKITPQPLLGIELVSIGCIIPALYLLKGRYVAARRVAMLAVTSLTVSSTLGLSYLFSVAYQLSWTQMVTMFTGTVTLLTCVLVAGHIINFIFHYWVYRKLTTPLIRNESEAENVFYHPFWRYSPFRGILIGLIVITSNMNSFGTFEITTTRIQQDVAKQYGPHAYVFVERIIQNKNNEKVFAESIVFDGKKFVTKSFNY